MKGSPERLYLSEEDCPKVWISLPRARRSQKLRFDWRSSCTTGAQSLWSLIGWTRMGDKNLRTFWLEKDGKSPPDWECLSIHRKMQFFLSVYVDDMKMSAKSKKHAEDVGNIAKESRFGRPNIITWSGMSWMSSATSTSQQQTCDGKTEIVFEADQHKNRCQNWREESQRHHSLELRHGRSRSKVCWTLWPPGAQDGWQTPQGAHTSFGRSPSKTRRSGNCESVFRDLLSDCIDMLVLGNNWKTRFILDRELLGNISHTVEPRVRFATRASHQLHSSHIQQQTILSRWETSNRLQTWIIPRRRFCRKSVWLRVNVRWCCVHICTAYVCANYMGL